MTFVVVSLLLTWSRYPTWFSIVFISNLDHARACKVACSGAKGYIVTEF